MPRQPPKRPAAAERHLPGGRRASRLEGAPSKLPRHPYRDSAVLHGVLALLIVGIAWLTGGGLGRAAVIGLAYFAAATAWSWWRFRRRIDAATRRAARNGERVPDRSEDGTGKP
jgi:hypothetical protein